MINWLMTRLRVIFCWLTNCPCRWRYDDDWI